jgi:monovalent cation:H+ antiporter-2, CPA2 family
MILLANSLNVSWLFIELGAVILVLALLARLAVYLKSSPIPFYLLLGLMFGSGGLIPLTLSEEFIQVGAEIGVILLLFMIGLEYTGEELRSSLRAGLPSGLLDLVLGFAPGIFVGFLLGWDPLAVLLLGAVTHNTSSGVVSKLIKDLDWLGNRETPAVLSVMVLEDLAMAVLLPLIAVLLIGGTVMSALLSLAIAMITALVVLVLAMRHGETMSRYIASRSDEVILLTVLGIVLLVAGIAQGLQVSAAVGAFLVGIGLSGKVADKARDLLGPLRDLFAAIFFLFFSLQINPADIPVMLPLALLLGVLTTVGKMYTGWWAARRIGVSTRGRFRAGALLVAHGEFSIVIASMGAAAGLEADLMPLSATYVLLLAIFGPVLARTIDPLVAAMMRRQRERASPRTEIPSPTTEKGAD